MERKKEQVAEQVSIKEAPGKEVPVGTAASSLVSQLISNGVLPATPTVLFAKEEEAREMVGALAFISWTFR